MKLKNDRIAKIGDIVLKRETDGTVSGGLVVGGYGTYLSLATFYHSQLSPGQTQRMNEGQFIVADADSKATVMTPAINTSVNASDYLHADDALKSFEKLESALP